LSAKIDWRGEVYKLSTGGLMLRNNEISTARKPEEVGATRS